MFDILTNFKLAATKNQLDFLKKSCKKKDLLIKVPDIFPERVSLNNNVSTLRDCFAKKRPHSHLKVLISSIV